MAITIKNAKQIEKMRLAGEITGRTLNLLEEKIIPGITTFELDKIAESYIMECGALPSFKGYSGYPASICASINDEVVHGIPSKKRVLKEGDIVSIDVGAYINSHHGDAARTFAVGKIAPEKQRLIDVTKESFFAGIKYARAGNNLCEISAAIQDYVEGNGFAVIRDYVGHGIGREMHEDPAIPNYRNNRRGPVLREGMVLAIEPMVSMGTYRVRVLSDGWTAVTKDGLCAAHYENTVLITDKEPELLTLIN
jgi:methionyl aminopeptidase